MTTLDYFRVGTGITALAASAAFFYGSKVFFNPNIARYLELISDEVGITFEYKKKYGYDALNQKLPLGRWMLYIAWLLTYVMPVVNFFIDTAGMLGFFFFVYGLIQADPAVALEHWYLVWWTGALLVAGTLMVNRHYGYLYTTDSYARTLALILMFVGGCAIIIATIFCGILAYDSNDFNYNNNWITGSFWALIVYSVCMIMTFLWACVVYVSVFDSEDFWRPINANAYYYRKSAEPQVMVTVPMPPPPMPLPTTSLMSRAPGKFNAPMYQSQVHSYAPNVKQPMYQQPMYWAKPHAG